MRCIVGENIGFGKVNLKLRVVPAVFPRSFYFVIRPHLNLSSAIQHWINMMMRSIYIYNFMRKGRKMVKNYIKAKQDYKIALGYVMKSVHRFEAIICSRSMKFACFFHQFIDKSKRKLDNISWIDENCFPCEKLTMILIQCNLWEVLTTEFFLIEYQLFGIYLRSTYYEKMLFQKMSNYPPWIYFHYIAMQ